MMCKNGEIRFSSCYLALIPQSTDPLNRVFVSGLIQLSRSFLTKIIRSACQGDLNTQRFQHNSVAVR